MVARKQSHPNSLANLRPPWQKGFAPNPRGNPRPGAKISPAMHKYADWTYAELVALAVSDKANDLPMSHVIAITALMKAAKEVAWGDAAREFVTKRLDGDTEKATFNDNRTQILIRQYGGVDPKAIG